MTADQLFHVLIAIIGGLISVVGLLAMSAFNDLKKSVVSVGSDVKTVAGTLANHGERLASAETSIEALEGRVADLRMETNGHALRRR
jgi:hypothetical protein